jgi:hypothetical protein
MANDPHTDVANSLMALDARAERERKRRENPLASTLVVYPDGVDKPGIEIPCKDGFVSQVASAVANSDGFGCIPAAKKAAARLNAFDDMLEALKDMLSGWEYIRLHYGDLPGVGWDRAQAAAEAAIAKAEGGP